MSIPLETISLERESPQHAKLWIERADKRNAFDAGIIEALLHQLRALAKEDTLRVITLGGRGKHFSAGADLNWMRAQGLQSAEENYTGAQQLAQLLQQIDTQPQVIVARVQGAAFGGALGLICASHIAIGADNIRFCLSEARLGLLPAVISPYVVRAMGQRQARRYFASCEVIEAARAEALQLVHEVVPLSELDATCDALVAKLLEAAPGAQQRARALIELAASSSSGPVSDAVIDASCALIAELRTGHEGQEGMAAFLEKRTPSWQQ